MRVTNIALDYDEMPMTITFAMTAEVAARIAQEAPEFRFAGEGEVVATMPARLAAQVCKAFGQIRGPSEAEHEVYDCLTGAVFNRFYDYGADEALAGSDR